MGLFRKDPDEGAKQALVASVEFATNFHKRFQEDPGETLALMASQAPDPLEAVGRMLAFLVVGETINLDQLAVLGIYPAEFQKLVEKLRTENPGETLSYEAQIIGAIRNYNEQIDEIVTNAGVAFTEDERKAFGQQLAIFASENSITDLKVAYRLMKAEGTDPLKGATALQKPGYL